MNHSDRGRVIADSIERAVGVAEAHLRPIRRDPRARIGAMPRSGGGGGARPPPRSSFSRKEQRSSRSAGRGSGRSRGSSRGRGRGGPPRGRRGGRSADHGPRPPQRGSDTESEGSPSEASSSEQGEERGQLLASTSVEVGSAPPPGRTERNRLLAGSSSGSGSSSDSGESEVYSSESERDPSGSDDASGSDVDDAGSGSGSGGSGGSSATGSLDGSESGGEAPVEVRVHVHQARKLAAKDTGRGSDPYARAYCFGSYRQTAVRKKQTDPIWDEELQFSGSRRQLEGGMLKLEVWDYDWPDSDDIIGSFTFDLDDVRRRPNKEYYKAWVTLFNTSPGSAKEDGPQGDVLLSVTVLEPGDELPPRPGRPCSEEAGEVKSFDLSLSCYCAEALPQMDKSGLADPYISVSWSGKKARTAEAKGTLKPDFDQELTLPVDSLLESIR